MKENTWLHLALTACLCVTACGYMIIGITLIHEMLGLVDRSVTTVIFTKSFLYAAWAGNCLAVVLVLLLRKGFKSKKSSLSLNVKTVITFVYFAGTFPWLLAHTIELILSIIGA